MRPGVRHGTKSRSSIVFISRPSEVKDLSWSIYQHDCQNQFVPDSAQNRVYFLLAVKEVQQ